MELLVFRSLFHSVTTFQARVEDGLLIYEAFPYYQSKADNHLKIRFKKVQHNLIVKERKVKYRKRGEEILDEYEELKNDQGQWFRYFSDISGYSGVSALWTNLDF